LDDENFISDEEDEVLYEGVNGVYYVALYNESTLDGCCAAAILDQRFNQDRELLHFVGIRKEEDWKKAFVDIDKYSRIYIVGLAIPPAYRSYLALTSEWDRVYWYDYHPESVRWTYKNEIRGKHDRWFFRGDRYPEYSAAEMVWLHLLMEPYVKTVYLIGRDCIGDRKNTDAAAFAKAMRNLPDTSFRSPVWKSLLPQCYETDEENKKGVKERRKFTNNLIASGR